VHTRELILNELTVIPERPVPNLHTVIKQLASAPRSPVQNPVGQRYSILSINVNSGIYFFHLPIVLLSWRRVGIEPLFIIVYSETVKFDIFTNLTLSYLIELNAKVVYFKSVPDYEITTAMVVREMSGIIPEYLVKDNDWLITTDSDLYPIEFEYYASLSKNDDSIRIWNADCCGSFEYNYRTYKMYPMGETNIFMIKT